MNNEEIIRNLVCQLVMDESYEIQSMFSEKLEALNVALRNADKTKLKELDTLNALSEGLDQVIKYLESNKE